MRLEWENNLRVASFFCTYVRACFVHTYACTQKVKEAAYKGLVCPILELGSVWESSGVGLQDELEKVQNRATSSQQSIARKNSSDGKIEYIMASLLIVLLDVW